MSKFLEINDDVQKLFDEVLSNTSIPQWVEFKVLANNSQKDIYVVKKLSELYEYIADGTQIVILINEEIFEQLEYNQKKILIEEMLTGVNVNPDNDKISLDSFDFTTYSGMLNKYGTEDMIRLKESLRSLFDQKKQKEDELKESKKKK
jgi:hypothetical protein